MSIDPTKLNPTRYPNIFWRETKTKGRVHVVRHNGRKHTVVGTLEQARDKLRELQGAEFRGANVDPQRLTFAEVYEDMSRERGLRVRDSSKLAMRGRADVHVLPALGHLRIQKVTKHDLVRFANSQREKGVAQQSFDMDLSLINQVFKYALFHDWVARNPAQELRAHDRKIAEATEKRYAITPEEFAAFLKVFDERLRVLPFLLYGTGMRIGEACALDEGDFDFEAGFVYVTKTMTQTIDHKWVVGKTTKTKNGVRSIPLSEPVVAALKEHLAPAPPMEPEWVSLPEASKQTGLTAGTIWNRAGLDRSRPQQEPLSTRPAPEGLPGRPPHFLVDLNEVRRLHRRVMRSRSSGDPVFLHRHGGRLAVTRAANIFQEASRAYGGRPISPHILRHTYGSRLLMQGRAITEVAALLGDTPQTLLSTYAHDLRTLESERQLLAILDAGDAAATLGLPGFGHAFGHEKGNGVQPATTLALPPVSESL